MFARPSSMHNLPGLTRLLLLVIYLNYLHFSSANFVFRDFNETTGLWFVGSAGTTACQNDTLLNYGDVQGKADLILDDVVKEIGETTDAVSGSSMEVHQQKYNAEIEASQGAYEFCLHISHKPRLTEASNPLTLTISGFFTPPGYPLCPDVVRRAVPPDPVRSLQSGGHVVQRRGTCK